MNKKLLLIGFLDSPHFARWVEILLENTDYNLLLFGSSPARKLNSKLSDLMNKHLQRVSVSADSPKIPVITFLSDKLLKTSFLRKGLERCLAENTFDLIHFFEMQHSGYLLDQVKNKPNTKYAYSSYGSDIFWFGRDPSHERKISSTLENVDLVFYECERDMEFMRASTKTTCKFVKTVNSGGLKPAESLNQNPRNLILVKGYSNKWGMALWSLWNLGKIKSQIKNQFEVVIYSCDIHVPALAWLWGALMGIRVKSFVKRKLSHSETLELFEKSIMHVAISKSDGIPSSTLEAMRGGAIPIQSNTACMEDWITNGENGFLINIHGAELISAAEKVLADKAFVSSARKTNQDLINEKHSPVAVGELIASAYQTVLDN